MYGTFSATWFPVAPFAVIKPPGCIAEQLTAIVTKTIPVISTVMFPTVYDNHFSNCVFFSGNFF